MSDSRLMRAADPVESVIQVPGAGSSDFAVAA